MFQATLGPSSGEAGCIPDSHPHRKTSAKCRKNTVASPDYGPIVT